MEYLCTTCSKRKRRTPARLPALERYLSRRIRFVWQESQRLHKPLLILSGQFGLLAASEKISWYNRALRSEEVERLVLTIQNQLKNFCVSQLIFYALPRHRRGWRPYYEAIEKACAPLGVKLRHQILRGFV